MPRSERRARLDLLTAAFDDAPFTTSQASALGITPSFLTRATQAGQLRRLRHGLYYSGADPLALARHQQARLRARGIPSALASRSCAELWGIPVFGPEGPLDLPPPTLFVPPGAPVREGVRGGVRIAHVALAPHEVVNVADIVATTPLRTGFDIARSLGRTRRAALVPLCGAARAEAVRRTYPLWTPPGAGRAGPITPQGALASPTECPPRQPHSHDITRLAGDAALRRVLAHDLEEMAKECRMHGVGFVRRVLADVEPLIETWLEAVAWADLTAATQVRHDGPAPLSGLPRPRPQVVLQGASGRWWRVDFLLGRWVILEVDGKGKYADTTPWKEKERQSDLEANGYWCVRATTAQVLHGTGQLLERLQRAFTRSAA